MNNFNEEILAKAKKLKSVEELLTLAKENNIPLTREQAQEYYTQLNPKSGELADDELDNVAGGGSYNGEGYLIVSGNYTCNFWTCKVCGCTETTSYFGGFVGRIAVCNNCRLPGFKNSVGATSARCNNCSHCFAQGYLLCSHPSKKR